MGEAKRRQQQAPTIAYHHTSTLRTNLIWMSGVIELEGRSKGAFHPQLGEITTNANLRRAMRDFPPLAWFTTQIHIPGCLTGAHIAFVDNETGERNAVLEGPEAANALALQRVALGFPIQGAGLVPWPEHPGYQTAEGRELNDSAREFGDNPDHWYVSETPVDVLMATEFWSSRTIQNPRLTPFPEYLPDMRRMVTLCRTTPGVFIPPSWLKPEEASRLASALGLPAALPR